MEHIFQFKPLPGLKNPHLQTLLSCVVARYQEPESKRHLVPLKDQDFLSIEITSPKSWRKPSPIVLMAHGIGGSHKSPYMVRLATKLSRLGFLAVRMNFRGFGSGFGLAKRSSHGGSSDDLYAVIEYLKKQYPYSPLHVIGFSLSGNILLKLAGERRKIKEVETLIAVCPPLDLKTSSKRLSEWRNQIYQASILNSIIKHIESFQSNLTFKPKTPLKKCKTLRDFDEIYTAPASGFKDAEDYYHQCSCLPWLKKIEMPCKILFSEDDPLIDCSYLSENSFSSLDVVITKFGGHMGFLGYTGKKSLFWMDTLLLHWLDK